MRRKLSAARFSHTPDRAVTMNSESCTFRWTITFLLCFEIFHGAWGNCPAPPNIQNTNPVVETSGAPGDTVVYTCDRNTGYYEIPGKSTTITCQDDGSWTTLEEFCTRGCGPVPRLEYATPEDSALNQNIFLPNATVAYNCRPGYRRIPGSRTLTCQEDYTWSTPVPFCTLKSCGNPGDIDNGEMHAKDFLFGSRVTYTCNEGYRMISKRNYRDCEADSTWSNAPPECEVTICQAPALTSDVSIDPMRDEYSYLDVVRFICQKPLEVAGNNTAFCTSEGTWSSDAPTCKAVNCIDPNVANSRRLSGFAGPYKLNSAISFACNGNLVLKGSSTIVCNINSEWTPGIPECKEVSCGNLGTIANGKVTYENDLLGAKATYECDTRYALSASENTRICQKNEMWSGSAPSCIAICEDPITPPFANRIGTSSRPYFNGTVVHFSCKRGFVKSANKESTITCQGHSWSRHDEFCERISCGPPGQIPHGYVDALDHLFGSIAKYTCEEGYVMSTMQDYRTCQEDGKWSEEISCIEQEPEPGLRVWIIILIVIAVLVGGVIIGIVVIKVYKKSHQKGEYYCDVKADKFVAVCVDPEL